MENPAHQPIFTSSDYLAWEEEQTERHEFVAGELFLRDASEDKHVTVSGNLHAALHYHLRSSPCRTYASDMRLHVEKADAYFYPDVFVMCSKKDLESSKVKTEPIFIAEILSPSTAATSTATARAQTGCGCCIRSGCMKPWCCAVWIWKYRSRICLRKWMASIH